MSKGLQVETCKGCHAVLLKGAPRCYRCGQKTEHDSKGVNIKETAVTSKMEVTMSKEPTKKNRLGFKVWKNQQPGFEDCKRCHGRKPKGSANCPECNAIARGAKALFPNQGRGRSTGVKALLGTERPRD